MFGKTMSRADFFSILIYLISGFLFLSSFLTLESNEKDTIAGLLSYMLARILIEDFFGVSAFLIPGFFFYLSFLTYRKKKLDIYNTLMLILAIFNLTFTLNIVLVNFISFWNSPYSGYLPKLIHTIIIGKLGSEQIKSNLLTFSIETLMFAISCGFLLSFVDIKLKTQMIEYFKVVRNTVIKYYNKVREDFTKGESLYKKLSEQEATTFLKGDDNIFIKRVKDHEVPTVKTTNITTSSFNNSIENEDVFEIGSSSEDLKGEMILVKDIFEAENERQKETPIDFMKIQSFLEVEGLDIQKDIDSEKKHTQWEEKKEELQITHIENIDDIKEMVKEEVLEDMEWSMVMSEKNSRFKGIVGNKSILAVRKSNGIKNRREILDRNGKILEETLNTFGVGSQIENIIEGPVVTQYQIRIDAGVKVNKVFTLSDNIALALSASSVRISFVPEKGVLGVEVPNEIREVVGLKELVESDTFTNSTQNLPYVLGKSIVGEDVVKDFSEMPHLLIAGATGSGKSVCVNSIIASLLISKSPEELRLVMIDPKMVELTVYNDIPHLLTPVITDHKKVPKILKWVILEMELRYKLLEKMRVRNIKGYNEIANKTSGYKTMPYIMVIIDEFADLMLLARKDIEDSISRLAAMSRAVGIHLLLATQRPSVDVITGVIKANFPSRIAFQVSSKIDSRTILDESGADQLLGKGDMLYSDPKSMGLLRIQCSFLSDNEIVELVEGLRNSSKMEDFSEEIFESEKEDLKDGGGEDDLYDLALDAILKNQKASVSFLQRKLKIGYNRAARIMDELEERGIVSSDDDGKGRKILVANR